MKNILTFCSLLALLFMPAGVFSQVKIDSAEITASVPELIDFHEIIYPMWHDAYPSKNITMLKGFVPQIRASMTAIDQAVLPGILKDREEDWKKQLAALNAAAEDYYSAAAGNDDQALLDAAEKLHFQYEMMVRVIRPAIRELYEFHQSLYILYHKLYPGKLFDQMVPLSNDLVAKADALVRYPIEKQKRLQDRKEAYETASRALYQASVNLQTVLAGSDAAKKDQAVEEVHTAYLKLESVFK